MAELRQAKNEVFIEGILSEISLQYGSYTKDGKTIENIGGDIKIKTSQVINGQEKQLEIPVYLFANKLKKDGNPNPAFTSIEKVKNEFVSIAVAGEDKADRVRISKGDIRMNEFYNKNGALTSYPRIHATFVSKVNASDYKPDAKCSIELVVASKEYEVDKDGNETGRYKVMGIVPQYGDKVDIIPFYCVSEGVINAVSEYWSENDTFEAVCKLNFTSTTETTLTEVDFGEPVEKTRTINVSEIIITGGSQTPLEGEFAYDINAVQRGLDRRAAHLEEQKNKDSKKSAPAAAKKGLDLGF